MTLFSKKNVSLVRYGEAAVLLLTLLHIGFSGCDAKQGKMPTQYCVSDVEMRVIEAALQDVLVSTNKTQLFLLKKEAGLSHVANLISERKLRSTVNGYYESLASVRPVDHLAVKEAVKAFWVANRNAKQIASIPKASNIRVVVSDAEISRISHMNSEGRLVCNDDVEEDASIVTVSVPGFSCDRKYALVYIGYVWAECAGEGVVVLMCVEDGRWKWKDFCQVALWRS